MSDVRQLPVNATTDRPVPPRIVRPCDETLNRAVYELEQQLGTVEAYNRLCIAATALKAIIDAGEGKRQLLMFATDPAWIYPKR
jgi:hypothetical protein